MADTSDKSGKKSRKTFSLTAESTLRTQRTCSVENEQPEIVEPFSFEEFSESGSGLSSYEKRHIANIQKWDNIRRQLFDSYVEECCFPTDTTCVYCLQEPATLRCQYCGPKQYFCLECANILHSVRNHFHVLEKWKEGMFTPYVVNGLPLGFQCNCGSAEARDIVCIDEHGNQYSKKVWFCNCYHPTTTLIKNNLWPASPDKPATAFTFYLMDLMETVFLHCKVSLREFCEAVELLRPSLQPRMVFSIYQLLNQASLEEYRYFKYQIKKMTQCFPDLWNGTVCPLCPKENGILIESMDACFGLSRKKCQGLKSIGVPKHGQLMFADQDDVDNFVNGYCERASEVSKDCSSFHAGELASSIRSKRKE